MLLACLLSMILHVHMSIVVYIYLYIVIYDFVAQSIETEIREGSKQSEGGDGGERT